MLKMMDSSADVVGPINMGNPREMTIIELAEKVLTLVGGKSKLVFKPLPGDDPKQRQPGISMTKFTLGWEPKMSLDDGLVRTIDYFRQHFSD